MYATYISFVVILHVCTQYVKLDPGVENDYANEGCQEIRRDM